MAISRRRVLGIGGSAVAAAALGGGALGAAVYEGELPQYSEAFHQRIRIGYWLGLGGPKEPMPTDASGPVVQPAAFTSQYRPGVPEPWAYSLPPGHADAKGLPVVVVLHGWTDTHRFAFDHLGMQHYQARVVAEGGQPFVLASLDGETFYWHKRSDGVDWARLVSEGLLGQLAALGADTSRLGIMGWSMGGSGALRLAEVELRGKVKAVGAMSPAIYPSWDHCPQGEAFDSAEDYAANTPTTRLDALSGVPVHVACGVNDLLVDMSHWLVHHLPQEPQAMFRKGDHGPDFWRRAALVQLRFMAAHL